MAKLPSEETRLKRIASNVSKLPAKQVQNLKAGKRSREIIKHATANVGGVARPQDRIKKK